MNFHSWLGEFQPTELCGLKIKVLIFFFFSLPFSLSRPDQNLVSPPPKNDFFFNPFCPTYLSWTCGPCHATCPQPVQVRFCPKKIYFCLGSSSIYLKMNFTNSFFTFEIFFFSKIPFLGSIEHPTPQKSKKSDCIEIRQKFSR